MCLTQTYPLIRPTRCCIAIRSNLGGQSTYKSTCSVGGDQTPGCDKSTLFLQTLKDHCFCYDAKSGSIYLTPTCDVITATRGVFRPHSEGDVTRKSLMFTGDIIFSRNGNYLHRFFYPYVTQCGILL